MAAAVENSDVILMCVTEKYKNSTSCRSGMLVNSVYRPTCGVGFGVYTMGFDLF